MNTLSFVHYTTANQKQSGVEVIKNIRNLYPHNFYMVICDAGDDYYDVCKEYNLEYYHSQRKIGYPQEPYGYEVLQVLEFWERFYMACLRCNTSHIMYVEEDVKLLKRVTFPEDVEIYGYDCCWPDGTKFPVTGFTDKFMDMIHEFSGVYPNVNGYGAGACTIYKVQTFLDNFSKIKQWMLDIIPLAEQRNLMLEDPVNFRNYHPMAAGHTQWSQYLVRQLSKDII